MTSRFLYVTDASSSSFVNMDTVTYCQQRAKAVTFHFRTDFVTFNFADVAGADDCMASARKVVAAAINL